MTADNKCELPSTGELEKLSPWGLVAYAARSARRVQPLFDLPEKHPDRFKNYLAVDRAIMLAFAASASADAYVNDVAAEVADAGMDVGLSNTAAHHAAEAADTDAAANAATAACEAFTAANDANAAAYAAYGGAAGADANRAAYLEGGTVRAVRAAHAAAGYARAAHASADGTADHAAAIRAMREDYQNLVALSLKSNEPVVATEDGPLGPLWPDGEPQWYTQMKKRMDAVLKAARKKAAELKGESSQDADLSVGTELPRVSAVQISWQLPEFYNERELMKGIQLIYDGLDDLHRGCGGSGLKLMKGGSTQGVCEREGVPA